VFGTTARRPQGLKTFAEGKSVAKGRAEKGGSTPLKDATGKKTTDPGINQPGKVEEETKGGMQTMGKKRNAPQKKKTTKGREKRDRGVSVT